MMDSSFWQFAHAHATGIGSLIFVALVIFGVVMTIGMCTLYDWLMKEKK